MAGSRWAALAAVGAIAVGAVGCGGDGDSDKPSGTNIAVLTAGERDSPDWSRQMMVAAEATARKLHVRATVAEGSSESPVKPQLTRLARGAQIVMASYGADSAAAAQVAESTKVPTLVWGDPRALKPDLVGDVEFDLTAGAFQAGALAVHAARERSVGIVLCDDGGGGWTMPERFEIAAAYVAGARAAEPKTRAGFVIAGADAAGAKEATLQLVKRKMQMILSICGAGEPGIFQGIEQAVKNPKTGEDQIVGLIGDKGSLNRENVVVTSVLIDPTVALNEALRDIRKGTFGKRVYTLDTKNRGITLMATGRTPGDALEIAQKIELPEQIPTAQDEVTLEKLIAE